MRNFCSKTPLNVIHDQKSTFRFFCNTSDAVYDKLVAMNKEILSLKVRDYVIVIFLALTGILFGSFFDLSISKGIVNTSSAFGGFIETIGFLFSFLMIPLGSVMIFKGLMDDKRKPLKILGYVILVLGLALGIYFCYSHIHITSPDKNYGIRLSNLTSILISIFINIIFVVLLLFEIKKDKREYLIRAGITILVVILMQSLLIELIKNIACRPRYRYLIDTGLNTSNESFRSWWQFSPFSYKDDYHKSYPSGHTANSAVVLLLPLLCPVLRHPFKYDKTVLFLTGLSYTLLVAFFRIYYGAHYLSDVSFGLLFTTLIILLVLFIQSTIYRRKNEKTQE